MVREGQLGRGGGIRSLSSSAKIRLTSSLSSGLPGTMAIGPECRGLQGFVAQSSRSFAFRDRRPDRGT